MGTKYAPLLADFSLYSYVSDFIQWLHKKTFNFTFLYTDDVLPLNNFKLGDYDHIYLTELEIKNTTYTARSASFLDLQLEIDNEVL
jgi:hypothetical protein